MKKRISPEEAQRLIEANLLKFPEISCPLNKCVGRILRQNVVSDRPFPPFDRSMMDGYAIRSAEIGESRTFDIIAECPAGAPHQPLGSESGVCVEIMTGAIVPEDADCVVPYEATKRIGDKQMQLIAPLAHSLGDCIHTLGSDRDKDEVLLRAGTRLGARHLAIAASCGNTDLIVSKQPSIAIASTGDELVDISATPAAHQIRRSNDLMIHAALGRAGLNASEMNHLKDDRDECVDALKKLTDNNDVLILSGGISMGKKDYIPSILDDLGFNCHFHGVAQKPGKPFGFWENGNCAVFALPGNPISTLTCLHHYVIPALLVASGEVNSSEKQSIELADSVKARDDITVFLPVKRLPRHQASHMPISNSGDLVRILESDGYISLPPTDEKSYSAGKSFDFHPWY